MAATLIQQATGHGTGLAGAPVTLASVPQLGDALIAIVAEESSAAIATPTQAGVVWTLLSQVQGTAGYALFLGRVVSANASQSVTFFAPASALVNIVVNVSEWSGISGTDSFSFTSSGFTAQLSPATAVVGSDKANELLFRVVIAESSATPTSGPTNSFTPLTAVNDGLFANTLGLNSAYLAEALQAVYNSGWTYAAAQSGMWLAFACTLAATPSNEVAPQVTAASGTAAGQTAASDAGQWVPGTASSGYSYQWQRDNSGGGVYSDIAGATSATYTLQAADVGCDVRCVVAGNNYGLTVAVPSSNSLAVVAAADDTWTINDSAPLPLAQTFAAGATPGTWKLNDSAPVDLAQTFATAPSPAAWEAVDTPVFLFGWPAPPTPPTQQQMTIAVACVAVQTRVAYVRRVVQAVLSAPVVVKPAFVAPPISVVLRAVAQRILARSKQPHWRLSSPVVLALPPPPVVVLAAVEGRVRRPIPRSRLEPPTVVAATGTFAGPPPTLARTRPRRVRSFLAPPVAAPAAQTFAGPLVRLARTRPRPTRSLLAAPRVVLVPAVTQAQDTIRVALAAIQNRLRAPRGPASYLEPPTTLRVFDGPQVTLVATRPRPTRSRLAPPTVLQVFQGPPVEDRVSVALAAQPRRHRARSALSAPTTLATFRGPSVLLARIRPRPTRALLAPPILPPVAPEVVEDRVSVALAASARRRPRSFLSPPTTLETFSGPAVATARIRPPRVASALRPPIVVRVEAFLGPLVALARIRPRRVHAALFPPTVVAPKPPPPVVTTVTVYDEPGRVPRPPDLRRPHSHLGPPAVVAPTPSGFGIGGSGFPPDWAARLLERVELEGRDALDDDEVALLLILGLL